VLITFASLWDKRTNNDSLTLAAAVHVCNATSRRGRVSLEEVIGTRLFLEFSAPDTARGFGFRERAAFKLELGKRIRDGPKA
jgi:hypothetical protein